jgi:D-lactate dehydrogenase (cytochrome)
MFTTVGTTGFLYEIAIYWPGPHTAYHKAVLPAEHLAGLPAYGERPEAAAYVHRLKGDLIDLYERFEASHFQLGKAYPFASTLQRPALELLRTVKRELDPDGLMNPGALEL